jgi:hypothetical protein
MSTTSLVQAIKEFKDKQAKVSSPSDVVLQTVSWDLDTAFVGRRINASTVGRLSAYVDRRLEEYSAIHNSMPAVRTPVRTPDIAVDLGVVPDEKPIGHVIRINPMPDDDHVAHDTNTDIFNRPNPFADEESEIPPQRLNTEESQDEAMRECVNEARAGGVPAGAIYNDGQIDYPKGQEDEGERDVNRFYQDDTEIALPRRECAGISVRRLPDSTVEGFRLKTQDPNARIPLYHPLPEDGVGGFDGAIFHHSDNKQANSSRVGFADASAYEQSWQMGGNLDTLVNSQGLLPEVTNRVRDTFLREPPEVADTQPREGVLRTQDGQEIGAQDLRPISNSILRTQDLREINNDPMRPIKIKPTHVGLNPFRTPWPWPRNNTTDTTSYVTSYDIDHHTLKITARVLTVPSLMKVNSELWFNICSESEPKDLKEVIRRTVKANLLICLKKCRSEGWHTDEEGTEELALCTLREMISEKDFKKYLKYGFVAIKGKSGDVYQVFRNKHHTKVWRGNRVVEEICIRLCSKVKVPPTDNVIAFMTMISADEEAFKKAGNRYKGVL